MGVLALAGLEYGVIKQVNRLNPARFAPSICCLYSRVEETRQVLAGRIPVYELHHQAGRNRRLVTQLAGLLRRERVDVVHSHNWTSYYPAVVAARLAAVPWVVHGEHGRETAERSDRRLRAKRLLAAGVSRFVAVSPEISQILVEDWRIRMERIAYIPNGVDLDRFRPDLPRHAGVGEFGFPQGAQVVLIVGGIRPVKDHATLVRAVAQVVTLRPLTRLLIVGTDYGAGLKEELARLAATLGIREAVRFAGIRHDTPELLALSDVYVNSSVSEGMSNTILEAMATGKPVVATAVGGNSELVADGETGLLVPAGDPTGLARGIEQVLSDAELATRMGRAGRARVERRHRMERMVAEYENLYLDLWYRRRLRRHAAVREAPKRIAARGTAGVWRLLQGDRLQGTRLPILRYHRVLPLAAASAYAFPHLVTPRDVFERQMAHLRRTHHVLPLLEAVRGLREDDLPRRAVAVTLEDGYRDAYEEAWPVLRRYEIPATLFLATGVLDQRRRLWWDDVAEAMYRVASTEDQAPDPGPVPEWVRRAVRNAGSDPRGAAERLVSGMWRAPRAERLELHRLLASLGEVSPEDSGGLMLTWEEAREMSREGMAVGAHTRSHASLEELAEEEAYHEVSHSVGRISMELDSQIRFLSDPGARPSPQSEEILMRAGIEAALTGEPGLNAPNTPVHSLRTLDAASLRLDWGFDPGVLDAALAWPPGRLGGGRLGAALRGG